MPRASKVGTAFLSIAVPVGAIVASVLALFAVASPGLARAATNPAALEPVPLRQLYTAPGGRYFYTTDLAEAEAAPNFGLTMPSPRPVAYLFKKGAPDTVPVYRLKQKATGDWLETSDQGEIQMDVGNGTFEVEGISGYVYSTPEYGAELLERFDNGSGWRLAFASEAATLEHSGYELDGPIGYALRSYYQVGAFYFSAYDPETNPRLLAAVEHTYHRYPDPWGGVRDFSGDDPKVPQNTWGWGGDWSDLEPEIGFYDDSQPETLEKQIAQAASHGLSYFAFYDYWNDQTAQPQFDDAIKAFLQARNRESMKFMITPCITPIEKDLEHLDLPESQFAAAAADFASLTKEPNYLTTDDGRPMIFMCDSRGVGVTGGSATPGTVAQQNRFLGELRADVIADTGKNPYILINSDFSGPEETRQLNGDAYTCINIGRYVVSGSYREYVEKLGEYFSAFDAIKPTMRCAMSGFDERPRTELYFPAGQPSAARYFKDDTLAQFPAAMESTKRDMEGEPATVVDNDMTVYAWNEWAEGGHIEPNVRDHSSYLETLQRVFGLIPRDASVPPPPPPASPPPASGGGGKKHKGKGAGKPPRLSALSLKPQSFAVAPRGSDKGKRRARARSGGTTVSWHDSAGARTRLVVQSRKAVKAKGKKGAKAGHRWVADGFLVHKDKAGANRLRFSGRLSGKALRPGHYRLKLVAGVGGLHSDPVAKAFAVRRTHSG
jgi:hypothetical protein